MLFLQTLLINLILTKSSGQKRYACHCPGRMQPELPGLMESEGREVTWRKKAVGTRVNRIPGQLLRRVNRLGRSYVRGGDTYKPDSAYKQKTVKATRTFTSMFF
jgi:hypothetical protein